MKQQTEQPESKRTNSLKKRKPHQPEDGFKTPWAQILSEVLVALALVQRSPEQYDLFSQ